jgi:FtsZ-binding cell division protein ZapB
MPFGVQNAHDLVDTFLSHNERLDEENRQWQEGQAAYLEKMMNKGELDMQNSSSPFKF